MNGMITSAGAFLVAMSLFSPWCGAMDLKISREQVVRDSDQIVQGKILQTPCRWVEDSRGRHIYTYATVRVGKYLKGQGALEVVVEFPGGKVGEITERVSFSPALSVGQEVVLFLSTQASDLRPIMGSYGVCIISNGIVSCTEGKSGVCEFTSRVKAAVNGPASRPDETDKQPAPPVFGTQQAPLLPAPSGSGSSIMPVPCRRVRPANPTVAPAEDGKGGFPPEGTSRESLVNPLVSSGDGGNVVYSLTPIFTETFEGIFPSAGWTRYGSPTWDDTSYSAHGGSWSGWCADTGRNPADGYADNMEAWMVYGPFSLVGAIDARVDFWYKNYSEAGYDYFHWMASTDNNDFYGSQISGDQNTWRSQTFDLKNVYTLGNLCGQSQVWIAFIFSSDSVISGPTYTGPYVDDIVIQKDTGGAQPDLQVPNTQWMADTVIEGNSFWVRGRVYNGGTASAGTSHIKLYLSTDNDWDTADDYYVGTMAVGALAIGGEQWVEWNFTLPNLGTGSYSVWPIFVADSNGEVAESDENNTYKSTNAFTAQDPGVGIPTITGISPSTASAGTGTAVTISGTNFGTTQGSSVVEFFYRSGQPKITAPVSAWSDTSITCTVPTGIIDGYMASAGSGPVTVTTAGGTSLGYNFTVTFGYSGERWSGDWPIVSYRINENCPDCTGEGMAVQAAAANWSLMGAANFTFHYAGTTSATTTSSNSVNEILWGTMPSGVIAGTYVWSSGATVTECDIVFNDPDFIWNTSDSPTSSQMDAQTIALHEMGHWLFLTDLYGDLGDGINDSGKVMYGFGSNGLLKRTLASADRSGIQWIYGLAPASVTMTFRAVTANAGSHTDMTSSNRTTVTYVNPDGTTGYAYPCDGNDMTVQALAGSTYTYAQSSWSSTATHRWSCNQALSGTTPSSGSQTITKNYYEQYKASITLTGTDSTHTTGTTAHTQFGTGHADSGIYISPWSDWCDAGSHLTFSASTTGTPARTTSDTRDWIVTSILSAQINYQVPVSGTVTLLDFSAAVTAVPVTIEIRSTPVETHVVNLDSGGHYSFTTAKTGTYAVTAKAAHWLRKLVPAVNLTSGAVVNFTLTNGDGDGNNAITSNDLSMVRTGMDSLSGGGGWNPLADLDGNGEINSTDLAILLANLDGTGDE